MFKIILYIFLAYIAYQFIFKFLIPVYLTTRKLKKGFREMQSRMQRDESDKDIQENNASPSQQRTGNVGDYIDFEEVK